MAVSYPLYDQAGYNGDLALLRLQQAVQFSSRVRPVCLPSNTIGNLCPCRGII